MTFVTIMGLIDGSHFVSTNWVFWVQKSLSTIPEILSFLIQVGYQIGGKGLERDEGM
ncbi:MAG: hypothetical protein VST66_10485 [Nitrospirota bacterium]|nr:hypothetical protein [Nitrospirota bacterium]